MVFSHGCEKTIRKLKPVFLNDGVSTGGFNCEDCFLTMVYQLEDLTVKPGFLNGGVSTVGFNCEDCFLTMMYQLEDLNVKTFFNDDVSTG